MPTGSGVINKNYVSVYADVFGQMDKREIDPRIADAYRDDDFNSILNIGARKEVITQEYWRTAINVKTDYAFDTTGATVTGTGTATITTSTADLEADKYATLGKRIHFSTGALGFVQSKSTIGGGTRIQIVVKIVNGTSTHVAGEKLTMSGIVGGESSGSSVPTNTGIQSYTNKYGIINKSFKITDVEKAQKIEFTYQGKDQWFYLKFAEFKKTFANEMNRSLIFDDMSTSSFSDTSPAFTDPNTSYDGSGGGAIQTSRGLYMWIKLYGSQLYATGSGSSGSPVPNRVITYADVQKITDKLTVQRASDKQLCVGSRAAKGAFSTWAKNLGSSGMTSGRLNVEGKELDLITDTINVEGYELNFSTMGILDNDTVSGHPASKNLFVMPKEGMVETVDKGMKPALGMKYVVNPLKNGLGNEVITEIQSGAFAPVTPSGPGKFFNTDLSCKIGLDCRVPSQMLMMQVLA